MPAKTRPATMKGPAIFLAQFVGDAPPFNSFDAICGWAAGLGYKGVQVPTSDPRMIDLDKAATSQTYCDEIAGVAARHGLAITELSTHLQGQLVAVHPGLQRSLRRVRAAGSQGQAEGASELGGGSDDEGRAGVPPPRPHRQRQLYRRAGLAVPVSLAAAAAGPDRDRVRRTRAPLASDPRCL